MKGPTARKLIDWLLSVGSGVLIAWVEIRDSLPPVSPSNESAIMPIMNTTDIAPVLSGLFAELVDGTSGGFGPFILNSGDIGLLRSLDALDAGQASRSTNGGATIAAHAQHVRYGLSLMNRWAEAGGNPFADATWDAAWRTSTVDADAWAGIRNGLRDEAHRWRKALSAPREVSSIELGGMTGSIAHLGYHLGAIRQIARETRGPREGTF